MEEYREATEKVMVAMKKHADAMSKFSEITMGLATAVKFLAGEMAKLEEKLSKQGG